MSGGSSVNSVWGQCGPSAWNEYTFMDGLHAGSHYNRIAHDSFDTDGTTRTMELWLEDDTNLC
jgi:hypothetical protein